jgi:S1-C subfamily serine protease
MSELPNRSPEMPQERQVSLLSRFAFIVGFVLFVAVTVSYTPQIAKQIAYSWNIGVEQAKADVARKFLAENPLSEQRISWVAKAVSPGVVGIQVITSSPPEEFRGRPVRPGMLETEIGSGVIVDAQEGKGYVLTNYHVIEHAHIIRVRLSDGREVDAEVIGGDRLVDFAVLRIDAEDLEAIEWGDSQQVAVGEQVLAIGSPFGLMQTVTSGIISATDRDPIVRTMPGARRGARTTPYTYLQTDAAINTGNSGGPLVDMNGKLIGICTFIYTEQGGNNGVGFAIPSNTAKRIYDEIVQHGRVQYGWIGIGQFDTVNSAEARLMNQKIPMGAVVQRFWQGASPARDAGLQRGDIILRWGKTEVKNPLHLSHLVILTNPGTKETVEVFRGGEVLTFEITVGVRPSDL